MNETIWFGYKCISRPVDIPPATLEILHEVLAQQRMIIESNHALIRMLSAAPVVVEQSGDE